MTDLFLGVRVPDGYRGPINILDIMSNKRAIAAVLNRWMSISW